MTEWAVRPPHDDSSHRRPSVVASRLPGSPARVGGNLRMDVTPTGKSGGHIRLTSHPGSRGPARFPLHWGAPTAAERGPVVATVSAGTARNAIGAHGGSYSIYRALAISSGAMDPQA